MGRSVTAVPARFGQEPVDMVGYDRWQDAEGLVDASDLCREAWKQFGPEWRAARAKDLALADIGDDGIEGPELPADLVAAGVAMGALTKRGPRPSLGVQQRAKWWRYRSRVLRADADVWWMLWRYAAGDGLGLIAARHSTTARYVAGALSLAVRWWTNEAGVRGREVVGINSNCGKQGSFLHRVKGQEISPA